MLRGYLNVLPLWTIIFFFGIEHEKFSNFIRFFSIIFEHISNHLNIAHLLCDKKNERVVNIYFY